MSVLVRQCVQCGERRVLWDVRRGYGVTQCVCCRWVTVTVWARLSVGGCMQECGLSMWERGSVGCPGGWRNFCGHMWMEVGRYGWVRLSVDRGGQAWVGGWVGLYLYAPAVSRDLPCVRPWNVTLNKQTNTGLCFQITISIQHANTHFYDNFYFYLNTPRI